MIGCGRTCIRRLREICYALLGVSTASSGGCTGVASGRSACKEAKWLLSESDKLGNALVRLFENVLMVGEEWILESLVGG